MAKQGFNYIDNNIFVYQESDGAKSAAIGIDNTNSLWKLKVLATAGATPTGTAHITIDPAAAGNITITPNGAGQVVLSSLGLGVVFASATGATSSSGAGTAGQLIKSGGAGVSPGWTTATYPLTVTKGDVLVASASDVVDIVAGATTAGHVLTANGAGTAPTFQAISIPANVSSLSGDSGGPLTGALSILGTANQIVTAAAGANVTCALTASVKIANELELTNGDATFKNADAATTSPILYFNKNRALAALTSGDLTGTIKFAGYDGTQYTDSARITSTSSGTIANTRVAGDLKFYTHPDSAAADPTLRMTIASTGAVTIAAPDSGVGLTVSNGGVALTAGSLTVADGSIIKTGSDTIFYDTAGNTFLGKQAGTGGDTHWNLFTSCTAIGYQAMMPYVGSDIYGAMSRNTAIGTYAWSYATFGTYDNTIIGYNAYRYGGGNVCNTIIGSQACQNNGAALNFTIAIGYLAGSSNTGGVTRSNIWIGNNGANESNVIRIGTQGTGDGQQNKAYIAGIYNTAVGATAGVVLSDSSHQLGGLAGSAGKVLQGGTKPSFSTTTYPVSSTKGDIIYADEDNVFSVLAKNTSATRYLSNTGTDNRPAWAQIALATGVSGTLPASNGGRNAVSNSTTSNAVQMAVNTDYIATSTDGATLVVYTLPSSATIGDEIKVIGVSTGLWEIDQNASDTIFYDNAGTTPGATGKVTCQAGHKYSSVTLRNVASGNWVITSVTGAITLA